MKFPTSFRFLSAVGALLATCVSFPGSARAQTLYASVNNGPILKITSSTSTPLGGSITHPTGLAFGPDGNLYVSQEVNGGFTSLVSKVTVPGGAASPFVTGLQYPMGLAFNTAGDLFIADQTAHAVYKVPSGSTTAAPFASGLDNPFGLAFNSSGTLFIANRDSGQIMQVGSGGGVATLYATDPLLSQPNDLVFDNSGNLFVTNFNLGTVSKITGPNTVSTFATGLTSPIGIDFDPITGALYVAQQGGSIAKITGLGNATGTVTTFASGLGTLQYIAVAPSAIPEPSTYAAMAGAAMLGFAAWRRRRIAVA